MMFLFLSLLLIMDLRNRTLKKAVIPFYIMNVLGFLWIIFCPGNVNRRHTEMMAYFPGYGKYSLVRKIFEGVCSLLRAVFDAQGMATLTIVFTLLLLFFAFQNKRSLGIKLLTAVLLLYECVRLICSAADKFLHRPLAHGMLAGDYRTDTKAAVLGLVMLFCFLIVIYGNTVGMKKQIILFGALFSAMATKLVLGFSLAFLASGERTSIFWTFTLMLTALYLMEKYEGLLTIFHKKWFTAGVVLMNVGLFLLNYFLVCSGIIW